MRGKARLPTLALSAAAVLLAGSAELAGVCGPFTDVAADAFCPFVLEIFTLGITTGTTPTTYDPAGNVSRLQMAAFLSRTVDSALRRSSPRAIADQFWTPRSAAATGATTVGMEPLLPACDGADIWVPNVASWTISRVRGSDGKLLGTWSPAQSPVAALVAMDGVFVTAGTLPGTLFRIQPSQPPGAATVLSSSLGDNPAGLAFDGGRIWTANALGSVSIVVPGPSIPWTVTTVTAGFSNPIAALYDGANVWITDQGRGLRRLDAAGAILQTVTFGPAAGFPAFDGMNIWAPTYNSASVLVVRASSGAVLATLTSEAWPVAAAFDGQRMLVTNYQPASVSLWNAADLTPLGTVLLDSNAHPWGACSDGLSFWVALRDEATLLRF